MSDVIVRLDERVRLMSAVLAATDYPERSQKLKPHGTHAHARATRKHLLKYTQHPAVQAIQAYLDQGQPLEALFALVSLMSWPQLDIPTLPPWVPANFNAQLRDFYEATDLKTLWEKDQPLWDKAHLQLTHAFKNVMLKPFFEPFVGKIEDNLVLMPNISYPTAYDVVFKLRNEIICIVPPPLAWGDSPPWPYDEPTMITQSYRAAITSFGSILIKAYLRSHMDQLQEIMQNDLPVHDQFKAQHPTWEDQFTTLFLSAAVAMYLEDHVDEREYKSYMLMEKKARGMALLPGTVSVLRRYLQEVGNNDKYNNLIEFLPIFPKQLRVAQKIVKF
ncbi:MAG: hypothetical protein CUN56_12565 [Phototrophicales bacterium]|nr:MAG: hypothetical protein CUN56_12565 [Phototrophicales bacterium]RMG73152.1 MAG: DUF4932 domain-containing protein [Chloroflexota bacterium]